MSSTLVDLRVELQRIHVASYQTLTKKQRVVAAMIARGLVNKQIAHQLQISQPTASKQGNAIRKKMRAASRKQLVKILGSIL